MIRRIDLFMPPLSQYGVLHHFTKKFYEALMRAGVNCRLMEAERKNPRPFLLQLFNDPPDCTLSFNGLLPDDEGRFFCDMIKIPHVACLVDSPNHFFPLIRSPYNIITCVDRFSCDFFKGMKYDNVLFMPHAVEKNIVYHPDEDRPYDVLFLGSYIDFEQIAAEWKKKYPESLCKAMQEAAEITLSDQTTPYVQALVQSLQKLSDKDADPRLQNLDFVELLDELEMYIRGIERVRLIKAIKHARIDVFGTGHSKTVWDRHLGKGHHLVVHEAVPFDQAMELMKHAKIVLNSCAWIKDGAHERTFAGLACGAAVLTGENPFMRSSFTDGESILFYRGDAMNEIDNTISSILKDEPKRRAIAKKGRDIVMQSHTWDNRASLLLKELDPLLKKVKAAIT